MQKFNLIGQKFNHLTVIEKVKSRDGRNSFWLCRCDCGNQCIRTGQCLAEDRTFSCGCIDRRKGNNATHGMSKTRIYHEWSSMRRRCKPNSPDKKNYYDRNISVCNEWDRDFTAFETWAFSNGYSDTLSIDRINNDKGYTPNNCRWVPIEQQQSNKSNTIYIEYNGEMKCLRTVCIEIGFPYKTAHCRYRRMIKKNIPITLQELFKPIQVQKRNHKSRQINADDAYQTCRTL
jgi:hypothetical protein